MRHLSLFSGIGGFDLAAEWVGFANIAQIEIDQFCRQVLKKNFPNTKQYEDIKTFPAEQYSGAIDIITGGFPCQPFSAAGKRKGSNDDRHLWPEMLRIIQIIKPTWVIAENVRGLLNIEQGMVFEQACIDLEAAGYEVQPFLIPALGVNAPHKRERVWIIAHSDQDTNRRESEQVREEEGIQGVSGEALESRMLSRANQDVTNPKCTGYKGEINKERQDSRRDSWLGQWTRDWHEVAAELCSVDDGLSVELGKFKLSKTGHKNAQIKAYGNAIVPQIAYQIFKSLKL